MSKHDYEAIAAALKATGASRATVVDIAAVLKLDNVRFDLHTFCAAAGRKAIVNAAQSAYEGVA